MGEIEFRGKCKEDGEWIEGNLIINHNYCNNTIESCSIFSMDIIDDNGSYCGYDFVEIVPETIGQYTGLKDKNGTKIFEGDILKGITEDTGKTRYAIVKFGKYRDVNFEDSCYGFYFESDGEQFSIYNGEAEGYNILEIIEIAGNIYDNPELIGEEV